MTGDADTVYVVNQTTSREQSDIRRWFSELIPGEDDKLMVCSLWERRRSSTQSRCTSWVSRR